MQTLEILNALPNLTIDDRLKVILSALTLNQEQRSHLTLEQNRQYIDIALAALSVIGDYEPGSELLAFEKLNGEDFQKS